MRKFNYVLWSVWIALGLTMAFLLYARYHPNLLVKIIGNKGMPGQLGGIHLADNRFLVVEEMIDHDEGIGVEGGAGFSVQLKKLVCFNLETLQSRAIGLAINSRVLGCSNGLVWVFKQEKGLVGLSVPDGNEVMNWDNLIAINPMLKDRVQNLPESFVVVNKHLWLQADDGGYWEIDQRFRARLSELDPKTNATGFPLSRSSISQANGDTLLALIGDGRKKLISGNKESDLIFMNGFFLNHPLTGSAIAYGNPKGYFIVDYLNIRNEGFRLTHLRESGQVVWQKDLSHALDRKNEQGRLAWVYPFKNRLYLLLDTNRGSRLVVVSLSDGVLIKNLRI